VQLRFGHLKIAAYFLNQYPDLKTDINRVLAKENLEYKNTIQVKHLLSVLYHDVGLERLKENISKSIQRLADRGQLRLPCLAAEYGDGV